jgi:hypothetical protein
LLIAGGNVTGQEEQQTDKATEITHTFYPTSPDSAAPLSPLSECESLPPSCYSSASPSSQSSEDDSASSSFNEETTLTHQGGWEEGPARTGGGDQEKEDQVEGEAFLRLLQRIFHSGSRRRKASKDLQIQPELFAKGAV